MQAPVCQRVPSPSFSALETRAAAWSRLDRATS